MDLLGFLALQIIAIIPFAIVVYMNLMRWEAAGYAYISPITGAVCVAVSMVMGSVWGLMVGVAAVAIYSSIRIKILNWMKQNGDEPTFSWGKWGDYIALGISLAMQFVIASIFYA